MGATQHLNRVGGKRVLYLGLWRSAFGVWRLALGAWRLALGVYSVAATEDFASPNLKI
jgi:hypothetical protein